jgi:bacterioferritin-associated ferredoxin
MIVCQCRVVSDRTVADVVAAGARTLSRVCQATGAGTDCGSCVFAVRALVGTRVVHEEALLSAEPAAS